MHVQHARTDAALLKQRRRRQRGLKRDARRDNERIRSFADQQGLTNLETQLWPRHDGVPAFAEPDIHGAVPVERLRHQALHFLRIARCDDGHPRQGAEDRDVLDGLMRRAERGIHHATAAADEPDVGVVQAKIQTDLLVAAAREERGDGVDVNHLALQRQARSHRDEVRLAHAFHEEALGHLRLKLLQRADAEVGADEHHAFVALGQLIHRVETRLAH